MQKLIASLNEIRGTPANPISVQYFEPETVYIPEGSFWMGSDEKSGIPSHECPLHEVHLPAYRIGKYPVTNDEYARFTKATGHPEPSEWKERR